MDILGWIFFGPARLIAAWPYSGLAIAAFFIALQIALHLHHRHQFNFGFFREATVFAGILWLIFNAFELQMAALTAQSGKSGAMRLDLMVLVPILYVMTSAAVYSLVRQLQAPAGSPGEPRLPSGDHEQ